jgi:uncharacterized OsmC-like protein
MGALEPFLTHKAQVLTARQGDFSAAPDKALVSVKASSKVAGNTGARPTRFGEVMLVTDSAAGMGGNALGPTAPELLLGALASCLVHTYLIQAALQGVALDTLEIEVTGRINMAGVVGLDVPELPAMQDVEFRAHIDTDAAPEQIQALHDGVETTCPVLNTFRLPIAVNRIG